MRHTQDTRSKTTRIIISGLPVLTMMRNLSLRLYYKKICDRLLESYLDLNNIFSFFSIGLLGMSINISEWVLKLQRVAVLLIDIYVVG